MRHLIAVPAVFLCLSGTAHAVDYQQLGESVDTGKATAAVMEQDMQKGYDAVDKPTAAESVDTGKAVDALMK